MVIVDIDVLKTKLQPYTSPNCNSKAKRDLSKNDMNYTSEREMFEKCAPNQLA